jgi:3-hydroxyisobutyrate dehydrogenase
MSVQVAFIGLGAMGAPLAAHLLRKGFDVAVQNRTAAKAQRWVETWGGRAVITPREAASGANFIVSCVGNDQDLRDVAYGSGGVLASLKPGAVWLDHTTASVAVTRELASAVSAVGAAFLDAPVSGGEAGAQKGQLSVMVGGDEEAVQRSQSVLNCYAKRVEHIGESGSGQLAKMVNQICIAGLLQALSEGLRFGENAGLDMRKVLSVLSQGAAQSWQMDQRAETMLQRRFDFGFAVDWMCKDLGLCLDEAKRNGSSLALTESVFSRYRELQALGHGRSDTSSLIALLER